MSVDVKISSTMLASAAALLLAGCASGNDVAQPSKTATPQSLGLDDDGLGKCIGVNSCKSTSACAIANSACAGQNQCKGQGWISTNKADCDARGGKFVSKN